MDQSPRFIDIKTIALCLAIFVGLGAVLVIVGQWGTQVAAALLWGLAALGCGSAVGFIFGVPKVLQGVPGTSQTTDVQYRLQVNTNLEQISDWLTKIFVGLGLIELQALPDFLRRASHFVGQALTGQSAQVFAGALLIYFSVVGFLGGYLVTRLFLAGAFGRADRGLQITELEQNAIRVSSIGFELDERKLPGGIAEEAARKIVDVPFKELRSTDLPIWAKAQFSEGNFGDASMGYEQAVKLNPDDVKLRLEYALALDSAKEPLDEVKNELLEAYKRLGRTTDTVTKENVYKALTFHSLYLRPPDGFSDAIKYAEEYTQDPSNPSSGDIWLNLAAGYGQKMRYLQEHRDGGKPDTAALTDLRNKALNAVKEALLANPRLLPRLQELLQKNYPSKAPEENDLEPFENDQDFREALHLSLV